MSDVATTATADEMVAAVPPAETAPVVELPPADGVAGVFERAQELLVLAGPVVLVLAAMSVVALTLMLLKLWQFHRARIGDERQLKEALACWREGRERDVLAMARASASPSVEAVARAVRGRRRGVAEARVREELVRFGSEVIEDLRGGLRTLEVIASLAPLLGLLGTVLGMIDAFRQLELAGNRVDPAVLSGGIWEALLTTAVGLSVAIPVIAVVTWLERRVDRFEHRFDNAVATVFTEDLSEPREDVTDHGRLDLRTAPAAP